MAEQPVDAGYTARSGRLENALRGVEMNDIERGTVMTIALTLDAAEIDDLAVLIERARLAGPDGSSRTTVVDLPGRHRKQVPAVGPSYKRKEETS